MIDVEKIKKYYGHVLTQVYAEPESPMHESITQEVWKSMISACIKYEYRNFKK